MAPPRLVDFNALPRPTRERFIACLQRAAQPAPLLADTSASGVGAAIFGRTMLIFLGAGIAFVFGNALLSRPGRNAEFAAGAVLLGVAFIVIAIFGIVRKIKHRASFTVRGQASPHAGAPDDPVSTPRGGAWRSGSTARKEE